jgi:hypothetical protein
MVPAAAATFVWTGDLVDAAAEIARDKTSLKFCILKLPHPF